MYYTDFTKAFRTFKASYLFRYTRKCDSTSHLRQRGNLQQHYVRIAFSEFNQAISVENTMEIYLHP